MTLTVFNTGASDLVRAKYRVDRQIWCRFCGVSVANNRAQRQAHESSKTHQRNRERFIADIGRERDAGEREARSLDRELAQMRQNALGQLASDRGAAAAQAVSHGLRAQRAAAVMAGARDDPAAPSSAYHASIYGGQRADAGGPPAEGPGYADFWQLAPPSAEEHEPHQPGEPSGDELPPMPEGEDAGPGPAAGAPVDSNTGIGAWQVVEDPEELASAFGSDRRRPGRGPGPGAAIHSDEDASDPEQPADDEGGLSAATARGFRFEDRSLARPAAGPGRAQRTADLEDDIEAALRQVAATAAAGRAASAGLLAPAVVSAPAAAPGPGAGDAGAAPASRSGGLFRKRKGASSIGASDSKRGKF
ncbi:hypothetical protein H696_06094 [Fonticula alba]|uniref:U1-type domain-containing protein n=1 Tax=Fonticula alba TaxID=691883 RepID=A0A058YZR1_FONAL|nr:hypothetical protein H696_06094 [Fonticula alba]KCV67455.1 hypothetical protein H696_06094 [Fonticula alba]|eukprot:XP_009498131.1 hypothetical protein H696_06094 [Fonticula alba]